MLVLGKFTFSLFVKSRLYDRDIENIDKHGMILYCFEFGICFYIEYNAQAKNEGEQQRRRQKKSQNLN
jgi:hypothetical protein